MFYVNTSFTEHLPEDRHNRWPKHLGGYADYSTPTYLYMHLLVISRNKSSVCGHGTFKIDLNGILWTQLNKNCDCYEAKLFKMWMIHFK
jgi:hypothetical protein